ncbi:hypothetical protein [Caloramator australicus]|uniref:Chromosome partition protein smc n=2 Tax=Caloramator TaxID=44258 RepID=I7LIK8_9CLOT|nr:hypothetical protein [Caloramator australicus]CCJ33047.1 Chromosome partition protein smc [Caloramator australicus RC3]
MDNEKVLDLMQKIYEEMQQGFKSLNNRMDELENEVNKTKLIIENDIKSKVAVLFEGNSSYKEQVEGKFEEIIKEQQGTREILSLSVKSLADDIQGIKHDIDELKHKFDKVEKVTIQNTYDLAYLKMAK